MERLLKVNKFYWIGGALFFIPIRCNAITLQPEARTPMTVTVPQNGNVVGITINQNDTNNNPCALSTNGQICANTLTCTGSPCGSGSGSTLPLPQGATNYIQNSSTLQSGATAYPDFVYVGTSSTINGPFSINGNQTFNDGVSPFSNRQLDWQGSFTFIIPRVQTMTRIRANNILLNGGSGAPYSDLTLSASGNNGPTLYDILRLSGSANGTTDSQKLYFGDAGYATPVTLNFSTSIGTPTVTYDLTQIVVSTGLKATVLLTPSFNTTATSATVTGAGGLDAIYSVTAGSYTSGGLATCGDSTHALGYNSSSLFTCQTLTGGGGGSAFSLAITTGGPNAFSGVAISSSNSTTEILFDSATTNGQLIASGTYYFTLNPSSVTLQGALPTKLGTVTTGIWNGTALTSVYIPADVAYNDKENNWSHAQTSASSWTITAAGLAVVATDPAGYVVSFSTSTSGTPLVSVSTVPAVAPSDYELTLTSAATPIMVLGIQADGHIVSSGTAPSITSCGSSPSVDGTDFSGVITVGGGIVTSCTLNFANAFGRAPVCLVQDNSTTVSASLGTITNTSAIFNTSATLGGGLLYYLCVGNKG